MSFGQFKDLKKLRFKDWAGADIFCVLSFYWYAIASRGYFNAVRYYRLVGSIIISQTLASHRDTPSINKVMRLDSLCYNLATEVVLLLKLGKNKVKKNTLSVATLVEGWRWTYARFCFVVHHLNFVIC
jgi:hypothetical protein